MSTIWMNFCQSSFSHIFGFSTRRVSGQESAEFPYPAAHLSKRKGRPFLLRDSDTFTSMPPRLNIPPVTRILLIALLSESILSAAIRYKQWNEETAAELHVVVPYLSLVPQLSFVYPWTFLTTTLVENNVFTLAIAGVTLFYGGRYLERAWTSREFAKFIVVASLIPNLLTFGTLVFFFAMTGDVSWTSINGTIPLQISFLIAFSQLVPTHTVTLFKGILSLRVPRFPALHLLTIITLSAIQLLSISSLFLVSYAFLISYTYLRFYKSAFPDLDSNQSPTLRGDASESFAFAEFFPGPLKPLIASLADAIFNTLVALKLCTPFSAADVSASRGESSYIQQRTAPGGARAEAERRRALALKALDQRLHAASSKNVPPPAPSGPSIATQPQPGTQTAMTSQPGGLLGETNYVPEGHEEKGGS
ncbi:similar to rhomboid family protein [Botrytis cinerea T4]|uniref:Similar to rhomboid family protein n=1 Tax=Botryotinia fuckeliana (strain T4) TaxID=999810 RepID=G2YDZ4_BOTF4|nr:similar to rhomboid family protein [Botrytis cinerea T4]